MDHSDWLQCVKDLRSEISNTDIDTLISPLQAQTTETEVILLAPNNYVLEKVKDAYFSLICETIHKITGEKITVKIDVGCLQDAKDAQDALENINKNSHQRTHASKAAKFCSRLHTNFTFNNFVEGKSNQLARAAAFQVAENSGGAYNPLFLYGGVGLGKTHLMHAIGNSVLKIKPEAKVLYCHSEGFVADMIKSLQRNKIDDFKSHYRGLDVLLIDDIQFFAGKERTQEEFFHTFNALLDAHQQIVLTCDRYPKEINGLEERLKSRIGWGLTVAIEPPELETRVAILNNKADQAGVAISNDVAFFIAKHIQSNVRELEGALKRVIANSHFMGQAISVEFVKESLKDLLALRARMVTVDNILRTVAEYYKIKLTTLLSVNRKRNLVRARQIAMSLAKELTSRSLPEIAAAFGGRDHTTVLYATRKIKELRESDADIAEDYRNLLRILSA